METTLAGIGTEKQFNSNNELDDPMSAGISLTPDQDLNHWSSFDPFPIDVDPPNTNIYSQGTGKRDATPQRKFTGHEFPTDSTTVDLNSTVTAHLPPFGRLDALANIASYQASDEPARRHPPPPPQLSSAPQTKADQQKMALQKFSKLIIHNIQNATSKEPGDLEDIITRVITSHLGKKDLTTTHNASPQAPDQPSLPTPSLVPDTTSGTMTKKEALNASQAISNLIKKAPNVTSRKASVVARTRKCAHCPVTVARPCDMRKHLKRHTRPYGCTYPKCNKRFGAKSDWKRHENSQHFQLEAFRCQFLSREQTPCGEVFYRAELFKSHLEKEHHMDDDETVTHEVKNRRIGRNGQGQFWCGFCKDIVRLEKRVRTPPQLR